MDLVPKTPIKSLSIGDMLTGQDGNKYVVCKTNNNVLYWEPVEEIITKVTTVVPTTPKPVQKIKEVREKYYWKDNKKKPRFEYNGNDDTWYQMGKSLLPTTDPSKKRAGYVWTTKFCNISYVVDIEYMDYSKTSSKFWKLVNECPPCIDAEDYPLKHELGTYHVNYDEQGNKFWCASVNNSKLSHQPLQSARKFPEGTTCTGRDGDTYVSRRRGDYDALRGDAFWKAQ